MISGYGRAGSSGAFSIQTANAGAGNGVSGSLTFTSGSGTKGSSGTHFFDRATPLLVQVAESVLS